LGSYYFHIIETNRRLEDEEGEDLPSLEAAMEQAEQIIREILESEEATVDLASIRTRLRTPRARSRLRSASMTHWSLANQIR
jgi:hypothetical protein